MQHTITLNAKYNKQEQHISRKEDINEFIQNLGYNKPLSNKGERFVKSPEIVHEGRNFIHMSMQHEATLSKLETFTSVRVWRTLESLTPWEEAHGKRSSECFTESRFKNEAS